MTGAKAKKASAAAEKAVKNSEAEGVYQRGNGYAVRVEKKNGNHRLVLLNKNFQVKKVTAAKDMKRGRGPGEPLTGQDKQTAEAAALAAVDGEVLGSHKRGDSYGVAIRTDDGVVGVQLDDKFEVVDTHEFNGDGPGGRGPGGHGPGGHGPMGQGQGADAASGANA